MKELLLLVQLVCTPQNKTRQKGTFPAPWLDTRIYFKASRVSGTRGSAWLYSKLYDSTYKKLKGDKSDKCVRPPEMTRVPRNLSTCEQPKKKGGGGRARFESQPN